MDTNHILVREAQRQLAELEASADAILTGLTGGSTTPNTAPAQAVTRATNALKAFESTLTRLQPLLNAAAATNTSLEGSTIESAWLDVDANRGATAALSSKRQPIQIPSQPATTLHGLIDSFREVLGVEIQLQKQPNMTRLLVTYHNAFLVRIALEIPESLIPFAVDVRTVPSPASFLSNPNTSGGAQLFQRLTSSAARARLAFVQQSKMERSGASPLELLLLWLATCAKSLMDSDKDKHIALEIDPGSGSLVPQIPAFVDFSWQQGWEAAAAGLSRLRPAPGDLQSQPMDTDIAII